ncbi:MAG: phosphatidylglycerophosphatase A [Thiotrichaceae bacterium]|nr:phosphatidylglycerophosphatase A [Thiotrichaceae bacterium]
MDQKELNKRVLSSPIHFLAFGFGTGLSPIAPGTVGTLAAIPIYLLIQPLPLIAYLLICLVVSLFGIWLCGRSQDELNLHDPGGIVWDEIAGYLITMILAPPGWLWIVLGFIFFRIFDIWKPWPIRWIDSKVEGGLGVMLDDIIAAVFALVALQLCVYFIPLL